MREASGPRPGQRSHGLIGAGPQPDGLGLMPVQGNAYGGQLGLEFRPQPHAQGLPELSDQTYTALASNNANHPHNAVGPMLLQPIQQQPYVHMILQQQQPALLQQSQHRHQQQLPMPLPQLAPPNAAAAAGQPGIANAAFIHLGPAPSSNRSIQPLMQEAAAQGRPSPPAHQLQQQQQQPPVQLAPEQQRAAWADSMLQPHAQLQQQLLPRMPQQPHQLQQQQQQMHISMQQQLEPLRPNAASAGQQLLQLEMLGPGCAWSALSEPNDTSQGCGAAA